MILDYTPRKLILFQNKILLDESGRHGRHGRHTLVKKVYEFDFDNDECSCDFNEDNIIFTVDDLKLNFDDIEWVK